MEVGCLRAVRWDHEPLARRPENSLLVNIVQQALIVVYTCVLVVKACYVSEDVCELFGFGRRANGEFKTHLLPSDSITNGPASDVGSSVPNLVWSRHLPVLHFLCSRHAGATPGGLSNSALLHRQRTQSISG
eukprot:2575741-Prymnesium_polylepis.2